MEKINLAYSYFILGIVVFFSSCNTEQNNWQLTSPNNAFYIELATQVEEDKKGLVYRVFDKTGEGSIDEILEFAPLGMTFESGEDFTKEVSLVNKSESLNLTESYSLVSGKQQNISAKYNSYAFTFENAAKQLIILNFKVFDEGIAFQYEFPSIPSGKVASEVTGYHLSESATAWLQPYDKITTWTPAYEKFFENEVKAGTTSPNEEGWCFPALFETGGNWVLLSEAGLDEVYHGSHLQAEASGGLYALRFPEEGEAMGLGERGSQLPASGKTPWRVITIAKDLQGIASSNLVTHVSAPSKIEDTSWIRSGRASWEWWSSEGKVRQYDSLKTFVDMAAEMGWEYSLVDAHWDHMEGGTIEDLIEYASEKEVGLLVWYNSGGPNNEVPEPPRDMMWEAETRLQEFKRISAMGIKGIKVDFFQSDKAIVMERYLGLLEDAAEAKLVVNFHGCTIPRGWRRTFPNMLTLESVKGAECYRFDKSYPEIAPIQHSILPFTRGVIGPTDYTPVAFSNQTNPHVTTYAHELALAVLFETGILHVADRASSILSLPVAVKDYLKNVPVTWDEIKYLAGYPGKEVVLARRKGETWYISGVNSENTEKELDVNLAALKTASTQYTLFADGASSTEFAIQEGSAGENLKVKLLPYGGFTMVVGDM